MTEFNIGNKNIIYSDSYLSVINKADRFFYAIFDQNHTIREASLNPVDYQVIEKLIYKGCDNYLIAIDSPSIHLPDGLLGKEFLKQYTLTLPHSSYLKDSLIGHNASTHYAITKSGCDILEPSISSSKIVHLSTVLADYLYPAVKDKVLAVKGVDYLYFCYQNQEGLHFLNRYKCDSDQDFIYYMNLCFSHLNLDFENTNIMVCGQVENGSPFTTMLDDYFGNWNFTDPQLLKIEKGTSGFEKHLFHELYMVYLCGL